MAKRVYIGVRTFIEPLSDMGNLYGHSRYAVDLLHQQKNLLASCGSCASDAPDAQNVNRELGRHVDPTLRPDLPLFPPRILMPPGHRPLRPGRPDNVWCPAAPS